MPIDEVLDACIADIRSGRRSVDDCVASHPEHRTELERLLPIVTAIQPPLVGPDPVRKIQARRTFLASFAEKPKPSRRWAPAFGFHLVPRPLRAAAYAINVLTLLVLTTSAVANAREAQPDELLYPLKTSIEQVQVVAARTPDTKAAVRAQIAAERLSEIERALASDKPAVADTAANAYATTMDQAQKDLESARSSGRPVDAAQRSLDANLTRQQDVLTQASEKGATGAEIAIREVQSRVSDRRPAAVAPPVGRAPAPPSVVAQPPEVSDPTPSSVDESTDDDQPARHIVQIGEVEPTPTASPTATATGTLTVTITATAVADATPDATLLPGAALTTTTATPTPDRATEEPTRTVTVTPTRRASGTPSPAASTSPTSQTPQTTPTPSARAAVDGTPSADNVQTPAHPQAGIAGGHTPTAVVRSISQQIHSNPDPLRPEAGS